MLPCLTLSIIRYGSRVNWAIEEKELTHPLHLDVVAIEKGAFSSPLDYGRPTYIYIYIYIRGEFNKFTDFFVQAFKIVMDSWDDWPIFMISGSNEQLQRELKYTLLKPDCHSWWISKIQSGREDSLEERYAIKFCFKQGKNATKTYGMLQTAFRPSCMNWASVFV